MINVDTLAVVLRVLGRTPLPRANAPAPVYTVPPTARIGVEQQLQASVEHALSDPGPPGESARDAPRPASDHTQAPSSRWTPGSASASGLLPPPASTRAPAATTPFAASAIALSPAGSLLLDAMHVPHHEQGPMIEVVHPLLSMPPQEPAELARAIERAVTRSGVFYDSHVARWAENDFPATELAREPQAAWSAASTAPSAGHAGAQAPALPHADAPALLRQQLEAHEAHRLVVTTELWPGQRARLEFEEPGHTRDHARGDAPEHYDRAWSTRLEITLPSLGEVHAVISLCNDSVECRVSVASRDAQSRLDEARHDLDAALRRCSLELAQCSVSHER